LSEDDLVPTLTADAEASLDRVDLALADSVARLAPHGVGNPEPLLLARNLQVMASPRRVGQNHLKMKVRQSGKSGQVVEAIGFNLGSYVDILNQAPSSWIDLLFVPERNVWNDREILQLRAKDLRLLEGSGEGLANRPPGGETPGPRGS
jgi:single-stranded-DNA-specific exonuclease